MSTGEPTRPHLLALRLGEPPSALRALGFSVGDDGTTRVGAVRLELDGDDGGLRGWTLAGVTTPCADLDGLPTRVRATVGPSTGPAHPNGAVAVDHVVVATPDVDRTVGALEAVGLRLARVRDAGSPQAPVRQAFLLTAEALVEVVGPSTPAGDGPATFWGLTVAVADLDAAAAALGTRLGPVRDAVQPGRRIAVVEPHAGLRTRLALMSPRRSARPA